MKRRLLSIALVLCLMIGVLPQNVAFAAEYERWGGTIRVGWNSDDESWAWETFVDFDDPSLPRQYVGELPAGVSFDAETNTLTLTNTEISNLQIDKWMDTPLHIVVSGDVRINDADFPAHAALLMDSDYAVTISGASRADKLSLYSKTGHALRFCSNVPFTDEASRSPVTYPDGSLTVKNLTLEATSDFSGENFDTDRPWDWTGLNLVGDTRFENVALTAKGFYGVTSMGDITFDGCTVTASTAEFGPLEERVGESNFIERENKSLIKDSDFTITASGVEIPDEDETLLRVRLNVLTIDGDSDVTIDARNASSRFATMWVHGDPERRQLGLDTGLNMKNGALNFRVQDASDIEGERQYFDPVCIMNDAVWTQTGGDVTVTFNSGEGTGEHPMETYAFGIHSGASFNMQGGTFTVKNLSTDDVFNTKVMALCGWDDSSLNFSGGTFTATGVSDKPYDVAVWVYDEMTVTGGAELDLKGKLQTETRASHIELFGGTVNIHTNYCECVNIGSALSVYGGKMNLTAPSNEPGIFTYQGNVRFLGGEVNSKAGSALTGITHADQFTFGEGVKAALADGTEAKMKELYYDGDFIGWATNDSFLNNDPETDLPETVVIKKQGVKADTAESSLSFELINTTGLVAGIPVNFRIIPVLTSTSDTLTVTLPDTFDFNGATVNNQKVQPDVTTGGVSLPVENGDIVRFTATPGAAGEAAVSASVNGAAAELGLNVESYTLSVPSVITSPSFVVFGSSAPGSTVTFYERKDEGVSELGSVTANTAGTWKAELSLDEIGSHTIYASVTLKGGIVTTSGDYVVTYDNTSAAVETLTVTNFIHGAKTGDPNQEVSVTLNYIDGTRSQSYYIYWPELPDFQFDVKFAGTESTLARITSAAVVATDDQGVEVRVPLAHDAESGLWSGEHEFCNYGNIIPNKYRVVWSEAGGSEEQESEAADMPSLKDAPAECDEDYATDVCVYTEPGTFALPLAEGTTEINGVTTIAAEAADYTVSDNTCRINVEAGEMYIVDAAGSFAGAYEGQERVLVICEGGAGDSETLQDNVIQAPAGSITFDDAAGTFSTDAAYNVGDVIYTGDGRGAVVTGSGDGAYQFRDAYIGEIYKTLDVGTMNMDGLVWEIDEEALAAQFMATEAFASYAAAIEETFSDEYKIGDHEVKVTVTAHADTDGVLSIEPVIEVTTKAEAKLPYDNVCETTITTEFSGKIEQDYDFRARFEEESNNFSLYFASADTTTNGMKIHVSVEAGAEEGEDVDIEKYFDKLKDELEANFLEELCNVGDKTATITFTKLSIPTSIPGVVVYAEPSFELNWGFSGELGLNASASVTNRSGFAVTYIGGEWVTATFADYGKLSFTAGAEIHVTAFVEAMLRADAGVSFLRVFDAGLYGKIGPRIDAGGHGSVSYPASTENQAELFARFGVRGEIGAHFGIKLSNDVALVDEDMPIVEKYVPLASAGWDEMPTRFTVVEGPERKLMPAEYEIAERISLAMDLQSFGGKETTGSKVYEENDYERYEFTVASGNISIEGTGEHAKVKVNNPLKPCDYNIRITFHSNNYELYKVVPLRYEPGYIDVHVTAEEVTPIAGIEIKDMKDSSLVFSGTTDASGFLTVKVGEGTYSVGQTSSPPKNFLVSKSPVDVTVQMESPGSATFVNKKVKEKITVDIPITDLGDPSGYVYEGIESNRLEGVTTTLYYKPSEESSEITLWDAAAFDQENPLTTDVLGQYLWMVPSGWWQVKYEKDGYETAYSEWMEVPPIRTGVNVGLVSNEPAQMYMECSEYDGNLLLRFTRPVKVSSLSNISAKVDGVQLEGWIDVAATDATWSVTDDPRESAVCATVFRVWFGDDVAGKRVTLMIDGVETYNGISGTVSDDEVIPEQPDSYTVTFDANGGTVEPTSAQTNAEGKLSDLPEPTRSGHTFNGWFTAPTGGTKITVSHVYTADTTIYAQWTQTPVGHSCTSKCDVCGGCKNAKCTEAVCKDKCVLLRMNFTDVEDGQWYAGSIEYVYHRGMMSGVGNNRFDVDGTTTRAMIVSILWRLEGRPEVNYQMKFTDVPAGQWYTESVRWAAKENIVAGWDGKFNPMGEITREQFAAILWRYAKYKGYDVSVGESTNINGYKDASSISQYAVPAVKWACGAGLMVGDGKNLTPQADATRAQSAALFQRFCEKVVKKNTPSVRQ